MKGKYKLDKRNGGKICPECGKTFFRKIGLNFKTWKIQKYCSMECYNKNKLGMNSGNRVKRIKKKCLYCNKLMNITKWNEKRKFCNVECENKYNYENGVVHKNKRILDKKERQCERCGHKNTNLVVHHNKYEYEGKGEENISNYNILCKKCHMKLHAELKSVEKSFVGERTIQRAVIDILKALKIPLNDENFRNTPARVSRMYVEMCEGLFAKQKIKEILDTKFPTTYEGMVISQNIVVYSLCPHHLLPVKYIIDVGIIFKKDCIGLSKIPRLVKLLAKKPVLQETLTHDIVNVITKTLDTQGTICLVRGSHSCMQARGVEVKDSPVTTASVTGCFATNDKNCKLEFYDLIKPKNAI